jgi:hypothetical protein
VAKSNSEQAAEQGATFGGRSRLDRTMGEQGVTPEGMDDSFESEPQNTTAAVWSDTVDLDASKLQIPFITLAQGLSKAVLEDKAKMGQFLVSGYEPVSEVIIVPLKFGVSRNYSERNDKGEMVTACYSPTGVEHGIALLPEGPGLPCGDCPLKDWQPTDKVVNGRKQNSPPPCKESYDFLVWSETHETLARMGFRSTGLKAGRLLATLGKTKGLAQFAVSLTSSRKTANGFTFAVPEVSIIGGEQGRDYVEMGQSILALNPGT